MNRFINKLFVLRSGEDRLRGAWPFLKKIAYGILFGLILLIFWVAIWDTNNIRSYSFYVLKGYIFSVIDDAPPVLDEVFFTFSENDKFQKEIIIDEACDYFVDLGAERDNNKQGSSCYENDAMIKFVFKNLDKTGDQIIRDDVVKQYLSCDSRFSYSRQGLGFLLPGRYVAEVQLDKKSWKKSARVMIYRKKDFRCVFGRRD